MSPIFVWILSLLNAAGAPVGTVCEISGLQRSACHAPAPPPPELGDWSPKHISNGF